MKTNKLKYLLIAAFCVVMPLRLEIQCMDGQSKEGDQIAHQATVQTPVSFVPLMKSDELMFSTIRILTDIGTGTGFIFNFELEGFNQEGQPKILIASCLVTNKHVIEKSNKGTLIFHKKASDKDEPLIGQFVIKKCETDFHTHWIFHPTPEIDLCILPLYRLSTEGGSPIFYRAMSISQIPSQEQLSALSAAEEILMVGYPNGLYDKKNNFPLFRKGIAASHPAFDFNGRPEFLIDIASFPGSSGSPVVIYNKDYIEIRESGGIFFDRDRFFFMGIVCAAPLISVAGEVKGRIIPSAINIRSDTSVTMHLGYVIKSKILGDFEGLLLENFLRDKSAPSS